MDKINTESYTQAVNHLKQKAKENGWEYYDIVEDDYTFDNGLLLIGYADEDSLHCRVSIPIELGHICVNVNDFY